MSEYWIIFLLIKIKLEAWEGIKMAEKYTEMKLSLHMIR